MNRIQKRIFDRRVTKRLQVVRDEIQELWDTAERRRHPLALRHLRYADGPDVAMTGTHDRFRRIEDYMKDDEKASYKALCKEEYYLSHHLGQQAEWGTRWSGAEDLGEDSPPAYMTVKEDRSRKIHFEYVEEFDMVARVIDGKWDSDPTHWRSREVWNRSLKDATPEFKEARDAWHAEDTAAGKAEIARLYLKDHPEWNLSTRVQ